MLSSVAVCALVFTTDAGAETWDVYAERDGDEGWAISRAEDVEGYAFRLVAPVDASASSAYAAFVALLFDPEYNEANDHAFDILASSDDSLTLYSYMDAPWPIRDRDVVLRYDFDVEGTTLRWRDVDVPERPPVQGLLRMPLDTGEWSFVPDGPDQCVVTATIRFDPGGRMPSWLLPSMAKQMFRKDLGELRRRTARVEN